MDKQEGRPTNRAPRFDRSNYTFWKIRMEFYLHLFGMEIWKSIEYIYEYPKAVEELDENSEETKA